MSEHETSPTAASTPPKKASSVRHTRAIARARSKQPPQPPPDEVIAARLSAVIHPLTMSQVTQYAQLGMRQRLLTLPVMVALVLSMIWRQVGSVSTLVLLLERQGFLWTGPLCVSQQALSLRLRVFPAALFRQVLDALLPQMAARAQARTRPLPPELAWAKEQFSAVLAVDGSTLDGLLKQVGLLRDRPDPPLAGRMTALLDLCVRLPRALWYEPDDHAHDLRCWPQILAALPTGALLLFDLGYTNFAHFAHLTIAQVTFVTRAKSNLAATRVRPLRHTSTVHDDLVWIGQGPHRQQARRLSVLYQGKWYRYLTNELDPEQLPVLYAVALYYQRWRIEDAYNAVKRLLGLAYFWVGSENGVQLQLWATWILYTVLVDLTDAIADVLHCPFAALSLEMVYRRLHFFTYAYQRGEATDVVQYLAADAAPLGILKRKPPRTAPPSRFAQLSLTLV